MSEVIRDVVVRITLEQIQAAIKAPDLTATKAVYTEAAKEAKTSAGKQTASLREVYDEAVKLSKEREQVNKKVADAAEVSSQKQVVAQLKVLDVTKQLGEGVFQLARGFAFLAASNDEDFRQLLATIAKLQGGFDLIKGGATTIKALTEGTNALKLATGSATVTQALLAGANTVVATTAGTATAAVTALKVALGPIGLLITGVGLAAAALGAAWDSMSESGEDAANATNKLSEAQERSLKISQSQLSLARDLRAIDKQALDDKIDLLSVEQKLIELKNAQGGAKVKTTVQGDFLLDLEGQQNLASQRAANNKSSSTPEMRQYGLEQEQLSNDLLQQRLDYARTDQEYQKQIVAIKNQAVQAAQTQLDKENQIVETAKKGVEAAAQKLAIEEKKLQSMDAQFGALSKQEQMEALALAEKVKAGEELNKQQLDRLSQLGGEAARDYVEQQRAKQGQESGSREFASVFGDPNAGITSAGQNLQQAIEKQAEAQASAIRAQEELGKATTAYTEAVALLRTMIDQTNDLARQVRELQATQDKNQASQQ